MEKRCGALAIHFAQRGWDRAIGADSNLAGERFP